MTVADVALELAVEQQLDLEDTAVAALQEAVSWRQLALVALGQLQAMTLRAERLEQRLHQTMGIEAWHSEQEMA